MSSIADRLDKLSKRPTKQTAEDMQSDLETMTDTLDEVNSGIADLVEQIETWADDDNDREMKAEAREQIETVASQLASDIRELLDKLA